MNTPSPSLFAAHTPFKEYASSSMCVRPRIVAPAANSCATGGAVEDATGCVSRQRGCPNPVLKGQKILWIRMESARGVEPLIVFGGGAQWQCSLKL
eukprot:1160465-Pelagomonas_calceolata.AAC.6